MLLGCEGVERPPEAKPPDDTTNEAGAASGNVSAAGNVSNDYTISVPDGGEFAYVYYSVQNASPVNEERFFLLKRKECLRLKGEQFKHLSIFTSQGQWGLRDGENSLPAKFLIVDSDNYAAL